MCSKVVFIKTKADKKNLSASYDFVDRVIPCWVARQHCPTLFGHGSKKINNFKKLHI
jgi:hypothetical protein